MQKDRKNIQVTEEAWQLVAEYQSRQDIAPSDAAVLAKAILVGLRAMVGHLGPPMATKDEPAPKTVRSEPGALLTSASDDMTQPPSEPEEDLSSKLSSLRERAFKLFPLRKGTSTHTTVALNLLILDDPITAAELADGTGLPVEKVRYSLNYFYGDGRVQKLKGEGKSITWAVSSGARALEEFDRLLSCVEPS